MTNKVVRSLGKREKSMEEELKDVSAATEVSGQTGQKKKGSGVIAWILAALFFVTTIAGGVLYFTKTEAPAEAEANVLFGETKLLSAKSGEKWGYVDDTGLFIINPQFDYAGDFVEGLACVKANDLYGYIDTEGKYVINPQFDNAGNFVEGLALVKSGEKWGYIDNTGKYVINPQFDDAYPFADGLARVRNGEKYGFIDKTGSYVINPQFDDTQGFSNGLAAVKSGDRWGYVDMEGKIVIGYQYIRVTSMYDDGYARVICDDKTYGIIDRTGTLIISGFSGVDGVSTQICKDSSCTNNESEDGYCYTHMPEEEDDYVYTYYCNAYGCLNKQVLGGYCLTHYYIYG